MSNLRRSTTPEWGAPGIRAQLVNIRTNKLEMDFQEGRERKFAHVLYAVSPVLTSSLLFAAHLVDSIEKIR